jgi:L-ascorbate metabolism protein UlaG (beta-lactamase superfamily)
MKLTRIDLNSWLLEAGDKTILIDPWLVETLVFYGQPWLFKATHRTLPIFSPETLPHIDLILLSQGLDDHAHKPTLSRLDRQIPVVGSPAAAKVVKELGFTDIKTLKPWEEVQIGNLKILAVPGAEVGQLENGFVISEPETTLYYEPHISSLETQKLIAERFQVDCLLIPVVGQAFPLLGEVLMGPDKALEVTRRLQPRLVIPTALGDLEITGFLPPLIRTLGSLEDFAQGIKTAGLSTELRCPKPGESVELVPSRS